METANHPGVVRMTELGNRLLTECRQHALRTGDMASIGLALTYVQAEFLAFLSDSETRLDEGIAIIAEQLKGRATERMAEIAAERAQRAKGMN